MPSSPEVGQHALVGEALDPPDAHHHHVGDQAAGDGGGELLVEAAVVGVVDRHGDAGVVLLELGQQLLLEDLLAGAALEDRRQQGHLRLRARARPTSRRRRSAPDRPRRPGPRRSRPLAASCPHECCLLSWWCGRWQGARSRGSGRTRAASGRRCRPREGGSSMHPADCPPRRHAAADPGRAMNSGPIPPVGTKRDLAGRRWRSAAERALARRCWLGKSLAHGRAGTPRAASSSRSGRDDAGDHRQRPRPTAALHHRGDQALARPPSRAPARRRPRSTSDGSGDRPGAHHHSPGRPASSVISLAGPAGVVQRDLHAHGVPRRPGAAPISHAPPSALTVRTTAIGSGTGSSERRSWTAKLIAAPAPSRPRTRPARRRRAGPRSRRGARRPGWRPRTRW